MKQNFILRSVVQVYNSTLGPEGLVPLLLVSGCVPRLPTVDSEIPAKTKRMCAMQEIERETAATVAELRTQKSIISKVPRIANSTFEGDEKVIIRRGSDKHKVRP